MCQPAAQGEIKAYAQTGYAQRQGLLDAAAILLWGVSGSLVAALLWEHRRRCSPRPQSVLQ